MKRGRFTEDQIIGILKEHEAGIPVADLCRKHDIRDATVYKWKPPRRSRGDVLCKFEHTRYGCIVMSKPSVGKPGTVHKEWTAPMRHPDWFDPDFYLEANPAVRGSGIDPWLHYLHHGYVEGRKPSAAPLHPDWFEPDYYLARYPEVAVSGIDAWQHFLDYGYAEGRRPAARVGIYDFDGLYSQHNHDFMQDPGFVLAYDRGTQASRGIDHQWYWRFHVGLWCLRTAMHLPGDFVEFGVNYGMLASGGMLDLDWNSKDKTFYLFDSFAGMKPEHIATTEGGRAHLSDYNSTALSNGFYVISADEVRANFAEFQRVKIVVGFVPDTLGELTSQHLAFVHIDMNNPKPEEDALRFVWDRIVPGGIILLDDYAQKGFELQKTAMDALAREIGFHILALPTGQGLILKLGVSLTRSV